MLSEKVDLTANHDFGPNHFTMDDLNGLMDDIVSIEWEEEYITNDEYNARLRWEHIFGKRRHPQQKQDLFPKYNIIGNRYYYGYLDGVKHCARCGKAITIPWRMKYDLCPECNEKLEIVVDSDHENPNIPWATAKSDRRTAYNLFNLR